MNVAKGVKKVAFEVWEGEDHVEVKKPEKIPNGEPKGSDDEEEEEEEERTRTVRHKICLGSLELDVKGEATAKVVVKVP